MQDPEDITRLAMLWQQGDKVAEAELFETLYRHLRHIAIQCLQNEPKSVSHGATSLVHLAYVRLNESGALVVNNRNHLISLLGQAMRRVVIDSARTRRSQKRGGGLTQVELADSLIASDAEAEEVMAVDAAMDQLAKESPRQAKVVEMLYFAGFSEQETADALGIATRTVRRDWRIARTKLRLAIDGKPAENIKSKAAHV